MKIDGRLSFAGDKSISHRALMLAALTNGDCVIANPSRGQDVESTRRCLAQCGIASRRENDSIVVSGGRLSDPLVSLDCGNSGTSARLLLGLLAGQGVAATLTGDRSLSKRPMQRVIDPLLQMGATVTNNTGYLPIKLAAQPLHGITYRTPVASAQVKSALLLAGLGADGATTVIEDQPTRDHTENMLTALGVELERSNTGITVHPRTAPLPRFDLSVPGDPSTAAFFAAAAAGSPGSRLRLVGLSLNPRRTGFFTALERMGAGVTCHRTASRLNEPVGDIEIVARPLRGITVLGAEIPGLIDELPILAVLAAGAYGKTIVRGAAELRVKESDRITALVTNLRRLGATVREFPDGLEITGPAELRGGRVTTYDDHRIAMAFRIAGLIAGVPIILDNPGCIGISAPEFEQSLNQVTCTG
ncbi:MAG: 3-phosphoshikimate 1-carboxyvinyltransferase [Candidatus Neomarinimicrobiota bacterium]